MAREQKATAAARAREAARERAAAFRVNEDKLEAEAVSFFLAEESIAASRAKGQKEHDALAEKLEARIAELRARTSERRDELAARIVDEVGTHQDAQTRAMENMLSLNISRREVAQRLGVKLSAVPRSAADDSGEMPDETPNEMPDETPDERPRDY